jgi:peptidoglycan/xylan/chitin deacetylase (PgdA/CDA1 family)
MSKVRCCVVVSLALLSLASRLPDQAATGPDVRRVTVVFRFDDYARWSSRTGAELLALFQKHRIPCTFAVIPQTTAAGEFASAPADSAPIDQETSGKLDDAVREGLLEVALHGYTHADRAALRVSGRDAEQSEFRGLDYSSQLRMLSEGRSTLESLYHVSVTTFIPPWNSYDENTLRALDSLGFKVVSGSGRTRGVGAHGRFQRLRYLPWTCYAGQLKQAVSFARKSADPAPVVVVFLHPNDFAEHSRNGGKYSYQFFDELLTWIAAQPDVTTRTLGEAATLAPDMSYRRLEAFRSLLASELMTPGFLLPGGPITFYPPTRLATRMRIVSWGRFTLFYLLLTAIAAVLVGLAASRARKLAKRRAVPRAAAFLVAGLLVLYVACLIFIAPLRNSGANRHAVVLAGLLGSWLGAWVAARPARKQESEG